MNEMNYHHQSLLKLIAFLLQKTAKQTTLVSPNCEKVLSRFHSLSPPKISIYNFICIIDKIIGHDDSIWITTVILIDRFVKMNPSIAITPNVIHKLLLSAVITSTNFETDGSYTNATWSKLCGICIDELNILEREFLFMLEFSIMITKEEFNHYNEEISKKVNFFVQ